MNKILMIKAGYIFHLLIWMTLACQVNAQDFHYSEDKPLPQVTAVDPTFRNAFIGASAGLAIPLGEFKSKDYFNYYSGYADNGFVINFINLNQKLGKNYGLGFNWSRSQFNFNSAEFISIYQETYTDREFSAVASNPWVLHGALGSASINVPHKIVDVDVRFSGGFGRATRPEILVEGYERATGYLVSSWKQDQVNIPGFMWGFGLNIRLHVTSSLDLFLQTDYQRMHSKFEVTNTYARYFVINEELHQNFEVLTLAFGLGFILD